MKLPPAIVPESETAATDFESYGGHLTRESTFGHDPLLGRGDLSEQRSHYFRMSFPDFESVHHNICNHNCDPFRNCLLLYITLTEQFANVLHVGAT